jgi:hypothetical protein
MPETTLPPPLSKAQRASDLAKAMLDKLGAEWITYEPETLWAEVRRITKSTPNDTLKGKIQAVKTLLATDAFWRDYLAFEKVVMAFNDHIPSFDYHQNPSPAMIALAVSEAAKIKEGVYSDDVLRYIAAAAFQEGLVALPEPLDIAQESLDQLTSPTVGRQMRQDLTRRVREMGVNEPPEDMYTETVTGIQLARARSIQEYVRTA